MKTLGLILVVILLASCSFKVEAGYYGQTAKDDRDYTAKIRNAHVAAQDGY